jgi:hypothetical protein
MTQLSMAAWRGYANLLLDRTNYVGSGQSSPNKAHIQQDMRGGGGMGEHLRMHSFMMGELLGGCSRLGLDIVSHALVITYT